MNWSAKLINMYSTWKEDTENSMHFTNYWPVFWVLWLYVLVMSRTHLKVNPHSIVAWMSRNSLLEAGAKSEGFAPASSKEFLDIQATIECGFTLKRVRDMTRTYSYQLLLDYEIHYLLDYDVINSLILDILHFYFQFLFS